MNPGGGRGLRGCAVGAIALAVVAATSCGRASQPPPPATAPVPTSLAAAATPAVVPEAVVPRGNFTPVARLVDAAVAAPRMPGAVVQIGHAGKIVFRQAFGSRKLPGEPGLDGLPAPAEPMTEDTIFDLASLTKSIATATAVLQLFEQGKVGIDEPLQTYLPDFNPANDPRRAAVTLRMVLTHTSGLAGDLSVGGPPWGLDGADKAEGMRRALGTPLAFPPGEVFHYSDIGFILLGAMIEKITGEPVDVYVQRNVFAPLGMTDTHYLPADKACGPHEIIGTSIAFDPNAVADRCPDGSWSTDLLARIAPTARDEDGRGDPGKNPNFDHLLRGTVHDPTARRMGGVVGSAGVFSTVRDMGLFAQALLDRLAGRRSTFPLTQSTVEMMTTPQQPGHAPGQLAAANDAEQQALTSAPYTANPLLAPRYPAIPGQNLRGFGWDIDTPLSTIRGVAFPIGSFGGGGFTGTSLWIDPGSDTYVVVLANVIHQRGGPPIVTLSGEIATETGRALHLYGN
ncbi:serine hydrolase domain-containing protein [Mycolicibacterium sp.]|uniref:serine hydrolase domain-containing protein n=1 Tax=Mycolicibacterium sp. TaxID=2320850 RepID=UPI0028B09E39|nr:serine hydrolase domain-containing protein [Mycolicibacterium sp.]